MSVIQVINDDCCAFIGSPFSPQFDCIFADPPFNIGQKYIGYEDKLAIENYRLFLRHWIAGCWCKLVPGAAFVLHGSVEASREMLFAINALNLSQFIETEICWAYNFGQHTYDNFVQTHCRAIVLRAPGTRKWYVQNVLVPSKRLLMGDKRVATAKHKGMVPCGTVWGMKTDDDQVVTEPLQAEPNWGRIQGNNRERRHGHPNQLPIRYVERFLNAYTQPGDLVFDPFGGSGTTAYVCKMMNRDCITTDISDWNCQSIRERLATI
jgi:DNA modification methylase